jgi:hypothetical protein
MMKLSNQIFVDLSVVAVQRFDLPDDCDTIWIPPGYVNNSNSTYVAWNPGDTAVAVWVNDQQSGQPMLMGQTEGMCRSLSGGKIKTLFFQVLVRGAGYNTVPDAKVLVFGTGKCIRANFADNQGAVPTGFQRNSVALFVG